MSQERLIEIKHIGLGLLVIAGLISVATLAVGYALAKETVKEILKD